VTKPPPRIIVESVGTARAKRTARAAGEAVIRSEEGMQVLRKGQQFAEGPKKPRRDALAALIDDALAKLGADAAPKAMLDFLRDTGSVEVDQDGAIYWRDKAGRDRTTTFKSLCNRLPARRKLLKK
jgi:hypothetical protein